MFPEDGRELAHPLPAFDALGVQAVLEHVLHGTAQLFHAVGRAHRLYHPDHAPVHGAHPGRGFERAFVVCVHLFGRIFSKMSFTASAGMAGVLPRTGTTWVYLEKWSSAARA